MILMWEIIIGPVKENGKLGVFMRSQQEKVSSRTLCSELSKFVPELPLNLAHAPSSYGYELFNSALSNTTENKQILVTGVLNAAKSLQIELDPSCIQTR